MVTDKPFLSLSRVKNNMSDQETNELKAGHPPAGELLCNNIANEMLMLLFFVCSQGRWYASRSKQTSCHR